MYTKYEVNGTTIIKFNADILTDKIKEKIDGLIVQICEGSNSFRLSAESRNTGIAKIKKELYERIQSKSLDTQKGMISEFFIHLILNQENFKQDCLFFNMSERSIKKGFDGIYSVDYFKEQVRKENSEFYIGKSFGEIPKTSTNYPNTLKVYVNLCERDDTYLTNISVIKLKIEQDFISYKLSRCFSFMYEFSLLTDEQYNDLMYGTNNNDYIRYIKTGLTLSTIIKLANDGQLVNLKFDKYNNLDKTEALNNYLNKISDFDRFQIEKVLPDKIYIK